MAKYPRSKRKMYQVDKVRDDLYRILAFFPHQLLHSDEAFATTVVYCRSKKEARVWIKNKKRAIKNRNW